jgi:L-amino acid N-acyltransferase YncA
MEFSVRTAREEDAASIVELLNPLIRGFPERGVLNLAVCDDSQKLLGLQDVVPMSPGTGAFEHVGVISTFVSLDSHGQGIGRSLSEVTFRAAKRLGFIKISAAIRADNPRAVSFYLSQGFRIIGTAQRHAFIRGKYVDEILAERFVG